MFTDQPNLAMVFFSATFNPQIGFAHRLSQLAEELDVNFPERLWQATQSQYTLRDPERKYILVAGFNTVYIQSFGLSIWQDSSNILTSLAEKALKGMGVHTLDRLSIKVSGFVDLKMTHSEMVDQMFGGILAERESLKSISDDFDDMSVVLYGTRQGRKFGLQINPQTPKQAKLTFFQRPNLDSFFKDAEDKYTSTLIRDSLAAIADRPLLHVEAEIFLEDCNVANASSIIKDGVKTADDIARRAVNFIRTLPDLHA